MAQQQQHDQIRPTVQQQQQQRFATEQQQQQRARAVKEEEKEKEKKQRPSLYKLALWHTKTFRPLMTHDELEPIMNNFGFVGYPPKTLRPPSNSISATTTTTTTTTTITMVWKEYYFMNIPDNILTEIESSQSPPPRARLPYPRIDGLHPSTYGTFMEAVSFYIGEYSCGDHLHVRLTQINKIYDQLFNKTFKQLNDDSNDAIFYRVGTFDPASVICKKNANNKEDNEDNKNCIIKSEDNQNISDKNNNKKSDNDSADEAENRLPEINRRCETIILHRHKNNLKRSRIVSIEEINKYNSKFIFFPSS